MKVGYVSLVGRPNAGKSSLLNAIIGEKVSIVSAKPQTTRTTIKGIYTDDEKQIIFLDTPGLHEGGELLIEAINKEAKRSLKESDLILRLVDQSRPRGEEDDRIDGLLQGIKTPVLTIYSKGDLRSVQSPPEGAIVVSEKNDDFSVLLNAIGEQLPEGPILYDEDYYTDQNMELRIAEVIREQAFALLDEEIPHAIFVNVETIEEIPKGLKILAYIHTEKESQKPILIGKNGEKITEISTASRRILSEIFDRPVHLFLRAKVTPNWRKNTHVISSLFPHV